MHTVHRTHLPKLINASIIAAILAIVVSLALAAAIKTLSQPGVNKSIATRGTVATASSAPHSAVLRWSSDPFANLISRPLPEPWLNPRP